MSTAENTAPARPPVSLLIACKVARQFLAEADALDAGTASRNAVYASHGALKECLRSVLAALDTEGGTR